MLAISNMPSLEGLAKEGDGAPQDHCALMQAFWDTRERLRKNAGHSARQIQLLQDEIQRLEAICLAYEQENQQRFSRESVALLRLGQTVMQLREDNALLREAAQQGWQLEKNLAAARCEYARLAQERDELAQKLALATGVRHVS